MSYTSDMTLGSMSEPAEVLGITEARRGDKSTIWFFIGLSGESFYLEGSIWSHTAKGSRVKYPWLRNST